MKNLRIPLLFIAASFMFVMISVMSCQNEKPSLDEAKLETQLDQDEAISQIEAGSESSEAVHSAPNMRFGPR